MRIADCQCALPYVRTNTCTDPDAGLLFVVISNTKSLILCAVGFAWTTCLQISLLMSVNKLVTFCSLPSQTHSKQGSNDGSKITTTGTITCCCASLILRTTGI